MSDTMDRSGEGPQVRRLEVETPDGKCHAIDVPWDVHAYRFDVDVSTVYQIHEGRRTPLVPLQSYRTFALPRKDWPTPIAPQIKISLRDAPEPQN